MKNAKDFSCTTYFETKTGGGQMLEIRCRPEDKENIKKALEDIYSLSLPATKKVKNIEHGSYGRYTRFDVVQHKYAGGHGGYFEILEIKNPPDERQGIVIHAYISGDGSRFWEFDSLANACTAWKKSFIHEIFLSRKIDYNGLIREVKCGDLDPWFYAVGDQNLVGDFVFPDVVSEDPIFRFGRKFILKGFNGISEIKTCMGVHDKTYESNWDQKKSKYKRVFWDDGSYNDYWEGKNGSGSDWPKPLNQSNQWIQAAIEKFKELLNGTRKNFEILFRDGSKFVGQWKPKNPKDKTSSGHYYVSLTFEDGKKMEGHFLFNPTLEAPTAVSLLEKTAKEKGLEIKEIHSLIKRSGSFGKQWVGVF